MMRRSFIRASVFNVLFYGVTALCCLAFLPLFILPRKAYLLAVKLWLNIVLTLERLILGLKFEVRGRHNIPASGAFIVAAKHQSAYETFKLHILFDDPAIVLKRELLKIPLWGAYLKKSGVIAIDRAAHAKALNHAENQALQVAAQGRPIIIFPQGTRVRPDHTPEDRPYKPGIFRLQEATGLPIIPMALNSGVFWPRTGWMKCGGKVVFEFLEPIAPGLGRKELMQTLELVLEEKSKTLAQEALQSEKPASGIFTYILYALIFLALSTGYYYLWQNAAQTIAARYTQLDARPNDFIHRGKGLAIGGFPGPLNITAAQELIQTTDLSISAGAIEAHLWPLPLLPAKIAATDVTFLKTGALEPLQVSRIEVLGHGIFSQGNPAFSVSEITLEGADFYLQAKGTATVTENAVEELEMLLTLDNHARIVDLLAKQNMFDDTTRRLALGALGLFMQDGKVVIPLSATDSTLYAGPLRLMRLAPRTNVTPNRAVSFPAPARDNPQGQAP